MKIRKFVKKYDPEYINIGFTAINISNDPLPQCIICFEILLNHSKKPYFKLQLKSVSYFITLLTRNTTGKVFKKFNHIFVENCLN